MFSTRYTRGFATAAGLVVFGVAGFINVSHTPDPDMKIVVGTLAAAAAAAAFVMKVAIAQRSYGVAFFALIGVIGGEAFGFVTTMERLLAARDARAVSIATSNAPYEQAKAAVAYAEKAATAECSTGRGRKCKAAEAGLANARAALAATPAPHTANHLAVATGLPPMAVDLAPSAAGTVALTLLGFVFLWFGHSTDHQEAEPKVPDVAIHAVPPVPEEAGRQEKVISWVREYTKKHGVPPSFTIVKSEFQLPKSTAHRYRLKALA